MAAGGDMEDARRRVPRQEEIAFAVAVVGEQVAGGVEVEVVGVAEAVGNHLGLLAIRGEPEQTAGFGVRDGGVRQGDVLRVDAAVVAADDIPPAIGPFAHGVAAVLAGLQRGDMFGRPIGLALAGRVAVAREPVVATEVKVGAIEAEAHAAGGRDGEERGLVRLAGVLRIVQHFDVAGPGDDDAALAVERHGEDVVGEILVGVEGDAEARSDAKAQVVGRGRAGGDGPQQQGTRHEPEKGRFHRTAVRS
jgi:hypothetical protein